MKFHRPPRTALLLVTGIWLASASFATAQDKLIAEGDAWKYFKGTEEPPASWNSADFNDSSWLEGATPIGYGSDKGIVMGTTLDDMRMVAGGSAGYLACYIRKKFTVSNPSAVRALKLSMKYDDGFVAYLNGVEILRKSMAAGVPTKDTVATDHEENPTAEVAVLPCTAAEALKAGDNVLAIEGHNVNLPSSDFVLSPELESLESVCPTGMTCTVRTTATGDQVLLRWTKPTGAAYDALALYRNDVLITPGPAKTALTYTDKTPIAGVNNYRVVATACGVDCTGADQPTCSATIGSSEPKFRRGDVDDNAAVNITDAVKLLGHLFQGQPAPSCLDAADADDNSAVNITDAVYILSALFRGGPQPPAPGADCGVDPTADELATCAYTNCQ